MRLRFSFVVVIVLVAIATSAEFLPAQISSQGTIYGTVTDPTGAVVLNAQVAATNVATGLTRETTTNADGDYRMDFLPPGNYRITVRQTGFETATLTDITLLIGQALRVNAQLKVGSPTQEVTVTAAVTPLNTLSASRGNVLENADIQRLPMNGREFLALATLVPGAVSGAKPLEGVNAKAGYVFSFNGGRSSYNSFYLDDTQNTAPNYNQMVSSPSIDAIQEFRIETSMFSARYGQGNDVISVVTKSGTNAFHGTLYEYHRNKVLDALPFFYTGTRQAFPNSLWNQLGGTIGGPIRKNKTFFFFNAEFFRQLSGGSPMVSFAPTAAERVGDVRNSVNPFGSDPIRLTNPVTGEEIPSKILPESLMTSVGKKLMSMWPEPNYPANPLFNYRVFRARKNTTDKYLGRVDHAFSSRDVLSGTFNYGQYNIGSPGFIDISDKVIGQYDRSLALNYTHTFGKNLVNLFGVNGTQFFSGDRFVHNDKNYGREWGLDPSTNVNLGPPWVIMFTQGFSFFPIGGIGDNKSFTRQFYLHDDLSWQRGSHTLLFGGMWWRQRYNWQFYSGTAQYYMNLLDGVNALDSVFRVTGTAFTNLLVATPNLYIFGNGGGQYAHFQRDTQALYLQDDWKVSRKLTLNLGIRWEYEAPFHVRDKKLMTFDQDKGLVRYVTGAPSLDQLRYPYETGGPTSPWPGHKRTFMPRFGFAFRPFSGDRTVVRAGYGIFFLSEPASVMQGGVFANPFGGTLVWTPKIHPQDGRDHLASLDQPPFGYTWVKGGSPGGNPTVNDPIYPRGYMEQWNLTFGHDLGHNLSTEIGYVANRGINLNSLAAVQSYDPLLYQKIQANYPGTGPAIHVKGYNSSYNSLQANVRKRMSHGFDLSGAYTWSHTLADSSSDAVNENFALLPQSEGVASKYQRIQSSAGMDIRHRFSVYGSYELPFGRGRKWSSNRHRIIEGFAGGWRANWIYTAQSGFPFTVYDPTRVLTDRVCDGNLPKSQRSPNHWFDYTCFPTRHVAGQVGVGNATPNVIFGPGLNNWDMGIHKVFNVTESKNFEFRMEGFNIWNHPQPTASFNNANWFYNTAAGAQITTARDQRQIQFALRFTF